jgi:glycosyltransferase involved in cell wall biosynthesis
MAVVLPTYNAAGHVDEIVERVVGFAETDPNYTFCFVNDGSRDTTGAQLLAAVERWAHPRVKVINLPINLGKGAAVGIGFACAVAEAEYLAFLDGDLPYAFADLDSLYAALANADVAIGSRQLAKQAFRAPRRRHLIGRLFNLGVRLGFGFSYQDTQAGLKAFRRGAAQRIFSQMTTTGFSFDVELLFIARSQGWRVAEVPVHLQTGHAFETRPLRLLRIALRMAWDIVRIRSNALRGRYDPR